MTPGKFNLFWPALALALAISPATLRALSNDEMAAIWDDPGFQKAFIGGYGINSEIEPRISAEELAILEKIRPLMSDVKTLPDAADSLKEQIKPESSGRLDFTLGSIYLQLDKLPEALEQFTIAKTKFPNFRQAFRNIGLIQARNGKNNEAIEAFTRMIVLGGGDGYSYGLLGGAYKAKTDYQASEAAYRNALLLQPDNIQWRLGLTESVLKQQKFEDAANLLNVLIERYPDKTDFWLYQANALLGMKQPLKAAENLEVVYRLDQGKPERVRQLLDSLYTLGDIYVSEGLMDLASVAYRHAIDTDLKQPVTRALRAAEMLTARGGLDEARKVTVHLREVRDKDLEDADRRKILKLEARLAMAQNGGNADTAKVLEEIVKLDPLDGEALMLLGQHYSRNSEPDRAIFYYERAANLEAFEVNAKVRQAQILVGLGRLDEAKTLLRRAQQVRPRDDVARYLEDVDRASRRQGQAQPQTR